MTLKQKRRQARFVLPAFLFIAGIFLLGAEKTPENTIVYAAAAGKAYHRENCSSLRRSKEPLTLIDAARRGLAACLLCKPPALDAETYANTVRSPQSDVYRVNIANIDSYRNADTAKMLRARVTRHIDGDTVELTFETPPAGFGRAEKIRLIGVDTPETVHPSKPVERFGKEASDFTKNALLGKDIFVALDWDTRDKYGRLLVYIYTAPGECHNAELIRQGYAHAYTSFPFRFMDEFRALEKDARSAKRGLWS